MMVPGRSLFKRAGVVCAAHVEFLSCDHDTDFSNILKNLTARLSWGSNFRLSDVGEKGDAGMLSHENGLLSYTMVTQGR